MKEGCKSVTVVDVVHDADFPKGILEHMKENRPEASDLLAPQLLVKWTGENRRVAAGVNHVL